MKSSVHYLEEEFQLDRIISGQNNELKDVNFISQ